MRDPKEVSPNPYRWLLHILLILYYTMGFMVRFAWPPLIPVASADLGISMASAGTYMSAFYIGYVLIHIPGGMLGDRFGARAVIATALLVEAVGTLGVGLAPNFAFGFACRVLTGLGAGAVYSSCVRYVTGLFPKKEAGLAFGLMMMAPAGVGIIIPNLLMPWLNEMMGWRGAFQGISVIVLLMGVAAVVFVRDTPSKSGAGSGFVAGLTAVLRKKDLVFLALAGFWLMWVMVGFVSWGNTYVKELGFSMHEASLVMVAYGVTGIIASPLGGVVAQKVPSPKLFFALLFLLLAPCAWFFGQSQTLVALCVFSGAIGFLLGLANPLLPLLTSTFAGKELLGTAGGVTGCIFQIGGILGPWLMGMSKDYTGSFSMAWIMMAVGALCGIVCLIPLGKAGRK